MKELKLYITIKKEKRMNNKIKTVIMAGGKGTRIADIINDVPKPMIKIENKPVLEHIIECLKLQGYTEIIITISYLGDTIKNYFKDGKDFGVSIEYFNEEKPLGNAGALYEIKDKLTEDFLLLNADSIINVDFDRLVSYHKEKNAYATILTHPTTHPEDCGLVVVDEDNVVTNWLTKEDERPEYFKNRVNSGIHVINKKLLDKRPDTEKVDLDRQILKPLTREGKLFAYDSPEYVRDMGTPERFEMVKKDFKNNVISNKNLNIKQKAIFLDRDGTINKHVGFLKDINDFELIDGVCEAIKLINESGYLAIVITNQPVVARGDVTIEELNNIHNKMETLLSKKGAYLDGIYYCPHHPERGFDNEIKELKIECDCRKPKPGLILKASKDFNIDLSLSWMIGDAKNDILAGKNAGCKTALIGNENFNQDITSKNLLDAIRKVIEYE